MVFYTKLIYLFINLKKYLLLVIFFSLKASHTEKHHTKLNIKEYWIYSCYLIIVPVLAFIRIYFNN